MQRLKYLPWRQLGIISLITALSTALLESLLFFGYVQSQAIRDAVDILFSPVLVAFMVLAIAVGVGALAVYYLERVYPEVILNASVLWALVLCLIGAILVKSLLLALPIVTLNETILIGMVVGVFWKGRRYWRRY
ncbi:MAG: peptide chain release factor 1 [Cyanobacteria bacterium CRU_2_1]|nr:peptide chain release factor 1 [Cyanobacteria bacterium RU_5_0]NJR61276.1 peptide chain release factor 1 [Cyanobacteria bacterium CRU_2_1]